MTTSAPQCLWLVCLVSLPSLTSPSLLPTRDLFLGILPLPAILHVCPRYRSVLWWVPIGQSAGIGTKKSLSSCSFELGSRRQWPFSTWVTGKVQLNVHREAGTRWRVTVLRVPHGPPTSGFSGGLRPCCTSALGFVP